MTCIWGVTRPGHEVIRKQEAANLRSLRRCFGNTGRIFQINGSARPEVPTIFCYHPADPPSNFPSCLDARRKVSNFSDTCEASQGDGWPGSHGNSCSLTVKPAARQPKHHLAPAPKPTRRPANKRIAAARGCNRCHSRDNKRSCPALLLREAPLPPREA